MVTEGRGLEAKVARSSVTSIARAVLALPVAFFLLPYTLAVLGPERYGIWALVAILGKTIQLGDFGMTTAIVKFVAERYRSGDQAEVNTLVNTALVLYAAAVVAIIIPVVVLREQIALIIFRVPASLAGEAAWVVGWAALLHGCRMIFNIFIGVIVGLQRMDVFNALSLARYLAEAAGMAALLSLGLGLRGLVIANGAATVGMGILTVWAARRLWPALRLSPSLWRISEARRILSYGVHVQVSSIMDLAGNPLNKLILTHLAGLEAVAFYDVAAQIAQNVRGLFANASTPLLAAASEIQALRGRQAISNVYTRALRYLSFFALPVYVFVFIAAEPFLNAWLGEGYGLSVFALRAMLVAQFISTCVVPVYLIFLGTGMVRYSMLVSVETGILSAILSLGLGWLFGFHGVVLGLCAAMTMTAIHTFLIFRARVGFRFGQFVQALSGGSLVQVGALAFGLWLLLDLLGGAATLGQLALLGSGYAAAYGIGIIAFRVLKAEDIRPAKRMTPGWLYRPLEAWLTR